MITSHSRTDGRVGRHGIVVVWFIVFLATFFTLVALSLNTWRLVSAKVSQENNTDADTLAATAILADNRLLSADETQIYDGVAPDLLTDAITEAKSYADKNFVDGAKFLLKDEDVLFGYVDLAVNRTFTQVDYSKKVAADLRKINSVRVVGYRTVDRGNHINLFGANFFGYKWAQMVTQSTAVLDRYVVGFDSSGELQVSPLLPIALFSDPTTMHADYAQSWDKQVEAGTSPPTIPYNTMTVNVAFAPLTGVSRNGVALTIGTTTFAGMTTQITTGVTATEFTAFETAKSTQFLLSTMTNQLSVDQHPTVPADPVEDLRVALKAVETAGTCRVFPLFTNYDTMTGVVTVSQFVSAKVSGVMKTMDGMGVEYVTFTATPCLVQTPTALTDPTRNGSFVPPATRALSNLYVCRVRMVD